MSIFEIATRNQFRFQYKGLISVEDLWQLPVENLDLVFKTLNSQVKQANEESLLNKKTKEDEVLDTKIEIVKYIVCVKLDEENMRAKARGKRAQQQKILSALSAKQEEEFQNKSAEELQEMLDNLDK